MPPKRPTVRRSRAAADRLDDRHLSPFSAGDRVYERVTGFTGTISFVTSAGGVLLTWDWWSEGKTMPYCAGLLRPLEPTDTIIDEPTFRELYLGTWDTSEPTTTKGIT